MAGGPGLAARAPHELGWSYLFFVPKRAVTSANGPVIVIWYVAVASDSDLVAKL